MNSNRFFRDGITPLNEQNLNPLLRFRGEWFGGTAYHQSDVVSYNGSLFVRTALDENTTFPPSSHGGRWSVMYNDSGSRIFTLNQSGGLPNGYRPAIDLLLNTAEQDTITITFGLRQHVSINAGELVRLMSLTSDSAERLGRVTDSVNRSGDTMTGRLVVAGAANHLNSEQGQVNVVGTGNNRGVLQIISRANVPSELAFGVAGQRSWSFSARETGNGQEAFTLWNRTLNRVMHIPQSGVVNFERGLTVQGQPVAILQPISTTLIDIPAGETNWNGGIRIPDREGTYAIEVGIGDTSSTQIVFFEARGAERDETRIYVPATGCLSDNFIDTAQVDLWAAFNVVVYTDNSGLDFMSFSNPVSAKNTTDGIKFLRDTRLRIQHVWRIR